MRRCLLSKANSAVAVDYSKQIKSLENLIKKYDDTIKSIKEMSKAIDKLAGTKGFDTLNSKMKATKAVANELKKSIGGLLTPISKEINSAANGFTKFTNGVSNMINSVNALSQTSGSTGSSLLLLGGVLAEIAAAFYLVAKASNSIKSVSGINAIFSGMANTINSLTGILNSFNGGSTSLTKVLVLLGGVLAGVAVSFYAVAASSSKIKDVSGITAIFSGIVSVLNPLVSLFETFAGSSRSVWEAIGLLDGVLAGIIVTFFGVVKAVSDLKKKGLDGLNAIFGGLASVLNPLVSLFETFAGSSRSIWEAIGLLDGVLAGIIVTFFGVVKAVSDLKKNGLEGLSIIFSGITSVLTQLVAILVVFSESGESVWTMVGLLATALLGLAVAVAIIAASTQLIDQEGLAGIQIILTGLIDVLTAFTALIVAFTESGMSLGEAIGLLIVVFGAVLVLGAALIAGAAILANNPQYLIALKALTESICAILTIIAATLPTILDACAQFITAVAPYVIQLLETIGDIIVKIIEMLGTVLPPIINSVGTLFSNIFSGIANVIKTVGDVLVNILNTLKGLVTTVLDSVLNFIDKLGPAINNFVDNAIQAVTKLINFIISGIEYLINTLFIGAINGLISKISGLTELIGIELPRIPKVQLERFVPRLAKGAVIPPRHEFLAVLGDQKHGTNIEAPLETIKQANREVMREFKGTNGDVVLKNLTVVTQFGNKEFKKMVLDSIRLSEKEIGKPLLLR